MTVIITHRILSLIEEIQTEYNMDSELVIVKALVLFRKALEAESEGNKLVICNSEDEIIQEITNVV